MLNSWSTAPKLRPKESLYNTQIFSKRHAAAFLHLGTLDKTPALLLGAILNRKITNERHKTMKNVTLNRPREGDLFTIWELRHGYSITSSLIQPHLGRQVGNFRFFWLSCICLQTTAEATVSIDLGCYKYISMSRWIHKYGSVDNKKSTVHSNGKTSQKILKQDILHYRIH